MTEEQPAAYKRVPTHSILMTIASPRFHRKHPTNPQPQNKKMLKFLIFALFLAFAAASPVLPIAPVVTYSAGSILPEYASQVYYGSHIYAAPYPYNYIGGLRTIPISL